MIVASNEFQAAMTANHRLWKLKVEIKRNDTGAPIIDITDRIIDCSISFDFERRNGTATLEIDNYDFSLSPMNKNSPQNLVGGVYNPLFDSNHEIRIYEGLFTGSQYEYIRRFTGYLGDEIDANTYPSTITLTARDKSKLMQDAYIFQSKTYGTASYGIGMTLEAVIQDMINEFLPNKGIIVNVLSPTNQTVGRPDQPYTAKDISLWDSCQMLADAFNHELRFTEDDSLSLRRVERDLHTVTPNIVFNESNLIRDSMSLSDSDVRNHIVLRVQGLDPIEKKNEASISRYGRRYMEITRAMANIISTQEIAHQFVDGLLKDMSNVSPIDQIEIPLDPRIQAGDIVCINNTKLGTDSLYDIFRVIRVQDSFSNTKKRTTMTLEGYIRFDIAETPAVKPVTSATSIMNIRSIQNYPNSGWSGREKKTSFPMLRWVPPTQDVNNQAILPTFGGYTIYRKHSSESVFYPIASVKSFIEPLNIPINYFYDYTAKSGVNQYRIVAVNKTGKPSTAVTFSVTIPAIQIIS